MFVIGILLFALIIYVLLKNKSALDKNGTIKNKFNSAIEKIKNIKKPWWTWVVVGFVALFVTVVAVGASSNHAKKASDRIHVTSSSDDEYDDDTDDDDDTSDYDDSSSSSSDDINSSSISSSSFAASSSSSSTVPADYTSALIKAEEYATTMEMSKQGVYDQLVSSYGEGFSTQAAQYAVNNLTDIDWNANALAKAKEYQSEEAMSPNAIYGQLTSTYGEQFTTDQANYAIQHLNDK